MNSKSKIFLALAVLIGSMETVGLMVGNAMQPDTPTSFYDKLFTLLLFALIPIGLSLIALYFQNRRKYLLWSGITLALASLIYVIYDQSRPL
jgi:hypothetical protein